MRPWLHSLLPQLVASLLMAAGAAAAENERPLLVVLTETGVTRAGMPVLTVHPRSRAIAAQLERGLSGTILRVYRHEQEYLRRKEGVAPEPAYLMLSGKQGGFARFGFWLGQEKKDRAAWVDIHRDWPVSGQFGAIDQIFPHELAHAIFRQLGVEEAKYDGGSNQIHAVGLRTDRFTAFNEGFAEHLQVMAIDDPGAAPATSALGKDTDLDQRSHHHLGKYRQELRARLALAPPMRMAFPAWYSNAERTLRYFDVKRNAFAHETTVPEHLLTARDLYRAYLFEAVIPGDAGDPVKPLSRMIATEGVVSALFQRWASSEAIRGRYRNEAFYEQFGTRAAAVTPLENLYLKLFHAVYLGEPSSALELVEKYRTIFPDEAPFVDAVVAEILHGKGGVPPAQLWLANKDLETGTTLFDQYRGARRVHTFDLNAASVVDLASVRGVSPALARAIIAAGPYASLRALGAVPGMTPELRAQFEGMSVAMKKLQEEVEPDSLSMQAILLPYLWRLLAVLILAGVAGGWLYRALWIRAGRKPAKLCTVAAGISVTLFGLPAGWLLGALGALGVVVVLFGIPAALWTLWKSGRFTPALAPLTVWLAAALPAALLTGAWFG